MRATKIALSDCSTTRLDQSLAGPTYPLHNQIMRMIKFDSARLAELRRRLIESVSR
jgi:hypothetical protein